MKRILAAVDGSEGANRAARFAALLAKETGAALELIHVYDAPTAAQLGMRSLSKAEIDETRERIASGSVRSAEAAIAGLVGVEHYAAIGHPAHEIVARAEESDADLIVLGSRGLNPIRGLLVGSVSRQVLELSKRPVTIVP